MNFAVESPKSLKYKKTQTPKVLSDPIPELKIIRQRVAIERTYGHLDVIPEDEPLTKNLY